MRKFNVTYRFPPDDNLITTQIEARFFKIEPMGALIFSKFESQHEVSCFAAGVWFSFAEIND